MTECRGISVFGGVAIGKINIILTIPMIKKTNTEELVYTFIK